MNFVKQIGTEVTLLCGRDTRSRAWNNICDALRVRQYAAFGIGLLAEPRLGVLHGVRQEAAAIANIYFHLQSFPLEEYVREFR